LKTEKTLFYAIKFYPLADDSAPVRSYELIGPAISYKLKENTIKPKFKLM